MKVTSPPNDSRKLRPQCQTAVSYFHLISLAYLVAAFASLHIVQLCIFLLVDIGSVSSSSHIPVALFRPILLLLNLL
jgi:hypothetical protein